MRYEDASQSGSSISENPVARDDSDALPAGDRGPATGNVISGAGTQTGASGADLHAETSHIVSINGAHGSDASFSGGKLVADGQFGRISIDREGNYSYLANKGAPESSRDAFTYKLADGRGHADTATLTIEIGKTPTVVQANAQRVVPGPNGVVVLPAGVELSDIHVVGRNLVIDLPDGRQMLIVDGAVFVPQLVLGDVEVPATSLAALLIGSELRPAAGDEPGQPLSGGGNFEVPVGPLDPGVPLGDLIPPTELAYVPPEFRESMIDEDDEPEILIQTPDQPAGVEDATARVFEEALAARPGEPAGSNSASTAETTTGTIVYESDDSPNTLTVNGVAIVAVGQVINGTYGAITITGIADGAIGYSYTLGDNSIGDATSDLFTVVITDRDGDTDTATLTVSIVDDVPTARADVDSVREDGPLVADGNVLTGSGGADANATDGVADTPGADGITLTAIAFGSTNGAIGAPLAGAYGSLVIGANGSYAYTLNNQSAAVQALGVNETLTETFNYTITDGDGDVRSTTLTITINGANDAPTIVAGAAIVSEEGLAAGNPDATGLPTDSTNSATASGQLAIGDVDGDALTVALGTPAGSLTSHGQPITWTLSSDGHVLTGSAGGAAVITVTVANNGTYSVALLGQVDHPNAGGEDILSIAVPVTLSDGTVTASSTLTVSIEDDSPRIATAPAVSSSVVIDETAGASPLSSGAPLVATSAGAIITTGISFGADGPGAATTYSLSLQGGTSIASGLQTALGDQPITLTATSSTLITATYNGGTQTAFTIQMNADGSITVTQFTALEHLVDGSTPAAFDDALSLVLGDVSLVNASATYTDFDGDRVTATTGIGGAITFRDDGPAIDVTANAAVEAGVLLTTSDDGTEGAGSTSASTASGNFGGTFGLTFDVGADGAPVPSLGFALNATTAVSGLTSHGVAINLYNVGGVIVGSTAGVAPVSATDASVVFAVSVNAAGIVTLTQYAQVDHPLEAGSNNAPFADQLTSLADGAITLTASSTIVDNDGDSASDSATINIGANLRFADDGPDIAATLIQGATIRVDETDGVAAAGGEVDVVGGNLGTVTVAAASLFTVSTVAASADAPTTNSYALSISAPGVASGLLLSTTNEAIVLVNNGGVIEGHVGTPAGAIAFTVSIDAATGATTLTQFLAVEHFNTGSNDEDSSGLTAGVLSIDVTATDYDGDTDVASVDLGSIVRFEDDGPSIDVTADAQLEAGVLLTTGDDGTEGAGSTSASTASGNFGGTFGLTFTTGSDGAAVPSLGFALNATTAVSGLTSHGVAINLYNVGGVIVGSTAGVAPVSATDASVVFAVSVNAAGIVTLTQYAQVDHPLEAGSNNAPFADQLTSLADGAITLTASSTIVDNDGDSASDSATINIGANLRFADDGPDIAATLIQGATIRVDETDGVAAAGGEVDVVGGNLGTVTVAAASLFTVSTVAPSADAPTTNSYALSISAPGVASGLLLSTTNEAIVLVNNGGVIEGHVGTPAGAIAFTVSIDAATGATTLTQFLAVEHPIGGSSYDEDSSGLTAGVLSIDVTATDYDGDTDVASVDLGSIVRFEDDGPTALDDSTTQTAEDANVLINVFANDLPGVDGALASSVQFVPGSQVGAGTLTNNGDGTFTLDPVPGQTGIVTFMYTITDGDGDVAQATATITLVGDSSPVAIDVTAALDDDGLTGGNAASTLGDLNANAGEVGSGTSSEAVWTGTLGISSGGADAPLTFSFAGMNGATGTVGMENVVYSYTGTTLSATTTSGARIGTVLFTAQITNAQTGAYTITLLDNIIHDPIANGGNDTENDASAVLTYTVSDSDVPADTDSGTVTITFDDDMPTAVNDGPAIQATENVAFTINALANDAFGADGVNTSDAASVFVSTQATQGVVTYDTTTHLFTYTPNAGAGSTSTSDSFSYTIIDADGDASVATVAVTLQPDSSPVAIDVTAALDDDGLTGGNAASTLGDLNANAGEVGSGTSSEAVWTGTLGISSGGADAPLTFSFAGMNGATGTVGMENVVYSYTGTTLSATTTSGARIGTVLFTAQITNAQTGAYTITLLDNIIHDPIANGGNDTENDASAVLTYTVSDSDVPADTDSGTVTITFDDDMPTAVNDGPAIQATENVAFTINALANDAFGADGVNTSDAASVFVSTQATQGVVTYDTTTHLFTYTPNAGAGSTSTSDSFSYTIIDADGDASVATVAVTLQPDSSPVAIDVTAALDDDGLTGGNAASTLGDLNANAGEVGSGTSSEAVWTGTLGISSGGADAPLTFSFAGMNGATGTVGMENVVYSYTGTTLSATTTSGARIGTVLFTAQITNAQTGAYTITLLDNIIHDPIANGGNDTENDASAVLTYTVSDSDVPADSDSGTVTITFDDDMPSVFYPDSSAALNGNSAPVNATLNLGTAIGADGLGSIVFDITEGQIARDLDGNTLTMGGQTLYLHGDNSGVITATTSPTTGGSIGYTVTINADGTYTFDVNGVISNGTETSFTNLSSGAAGNVQFRGIGADTTANNTANTDLLVSGHGDTQAAGTVNTNSTAIGVNNQSTSPGEGVRIDFVTNLQSGAGNTSGFSYASHFLTTHYEQLIPQVQGAPSNSVSIVVNAILADNDDNYDNTPADGLEAGETRAIINQVVVHDVNGGVGGVPITYTFTSDGTQGAITVDFRADGTVSISGLQANDQYEIDAATDFSAVVVEAPGGPTNLYAPLANTTDFDLGVLSIGRASSGTPINQNFNVVATDADGDSVGTMIQTTIVPVSGANTAGTSGNDTINGTSASEVLAGNGGNDTINGGDGADSLYGNGGNDVLNGGNGVDLLVGGTGSDTLTGGASADTFVIDVSALSGTQADTITDYAAAEVVDITQLLNTAGSLSGFVRVTSGGLLQVDANGGGDGFVTVATLAAGVNVTVRYANGPSSTATAVIVSGAAPILLDTNHDGVISYLGVEAGVTFDYAGDGHGQGTAWVGAGDSILVRDADGNGTVTNASEFAFATSGTDLQALHAQYGDQLDASDADFVQFMVWNDANSNGIADAGELTSLVDAGIVGINLVSDGVPSSAANGDVTIAGSGSFTYVNDNGETRGGQLVDVAFRTGREIEQAQRVSSAANSAALVTAAVAAVGLVATQAAAHGHDQPVSGLEVSAQSGVGAGPIDVAASADAPSSARSLLGNEVRAAAHELAPTSHGLAQPASHELTLNVSQAHDSHDMAGLLAPSDSPAQQAFSPGPMAAVMVIPSIEGFAAAEAAHDVGAQRGGTVETVLAQALDGGAGGGDIDTILASLPHAGGGNPALEALASQHGAGVSGWDMGPDTHLSANLMTNIVMDVTTFHHDAVQPVING